MSDMQAQLGKIRSDAAECLVLSSLANSERKEMFTKMAEHLNGLALEIEKTMAADRANVPFVEHRSAVSVTDPSPARGLPAVSSTSATAYQAKRPHRLLLWLLVIGAALIIGVFFRTNVAQHLGALAARVGTFETALENFKRVRSEGDSNEISSGAETTVALTSNLAAAARELEAKAALPNSGSDEVAPSRNTAEAIAAALQDDRKKTAAPPQQEREHAGRLAGPAAPAAPAAVATPIASSVAAPAPQPKRMDSGELAMLMKRAKDFLATGDIPSARLLLERAAEEGRDAGAAVLLARTYDPIVLGTSDVRNIRAEPEEALAWYRKAAELGSADAQQRLAQLSR